MTQHQDNIADLRKSALVLFDMWADAVVNGDVRASELAWSAYDNLLNAIEALERVRGVRS